MSTPLVPHATPGSKREVDRLLLLAHASFGLLWERADPATGLVPDSEAPGAPCSIAAVGLALTALPVAIARGWIARDAAAERARTTLRSFRDGPQGEDLHAMGYHGFYYHFLDMETGRRWPRSELSTIDSALFFAGALTVAAYLDGDDPVEREVGELADGLYRAADWHWALAGGLAVSHGWLPESGFLPWRWTGFDEALVLYVLGLGSPTHALPVESYRAWSATYRWKRIYGVEYLYGGPLFLHQMSHVWIDFRGIQDEFMRAHGIDYFENSRRATIVHQRYAMRNPRRFVGYGSDLWGLTACLGPGPAVRTIGGRRIRFYSYVSRGAPFGPDDGTIAPWAVAASLPFAPEIVVPTLDAIDARWPEATSPEGYHGSFNPTFSVNGRPWVTKWHYGVNQGPLVIMIDNYLSGLTWRLMRGCRYIITGLRRAGFRGGWLGTAGGEDPGA